MNSILHILLIFASGYIFKLLVKDYSKSLINFVLYIIFPSLIITRVAKLNIDSSVYLISTLSAITFFLGIVISYIAYKILRLSKQKAASIMLLSSLGNTSFLGFAFINSYYGNVGISYAIFFDQIGTMIMFSLFSVLISQWGSQQKKPDYNKIFKSIIFFPPLIAFFIGIVLNSRNVPFENILEFISLPLVPVIVFALGMMFTFNSFKGNWPLVILVLCIKMAAIPFVIFMFHNGTVATSVAVLESAMPPMILASIAVIRSNLDKNLAISTVGLGMILSFIIIPFWHWMVT